MYRRVGLLVAFGSAVLLVAGCSDDTYDHQYPKADVNVSLEKALSDHRVDLPAGAQGVQYSANSELEGYPLFLEFEAPCSEMGAFSEKNGLERLPMEKVWGTNAAVEPQPLLPPVFSMDSFARRKAGSIALCSSASMPPSSRTTPPRSVITARARTGLISPAARSVT